MCILRRIDSANTAPTSSSLIALVTSCVNILVLTLMHGRQLGWVCLGSCSADVSFPVVRIDCVARRTRLDANQISRRS